MTSFWTHCPVQWGETALIILLRKTIKLSSKIISVLHVVGVCCLVASVIFLLSVDKHAKILTLISWVSLRAVFIHNIDSSTQSMMWRPCLQGWHYWIQSTIRKNGKAFFYRYVIHVATNSVGCLMNRQCNIHFDSKDLTHTHTHTQNSNNN